MSIPPFRARRTFSVSTRSGTSAGNKPTATARPWRAGELRVNARSTESSDRHDESMTSLGRRQREVAELAALGYRNAEIAAELGISINTVKARLKEVFEAFAVRNRTELAHVLLTVPSAMRNNR
jgi:DNA-binding NarL/FixJ family response regulator